VLAVGGDQLWLVRADGRDARQITWEQDGVRTAVLSGDGRVAYALTFGGRIVRVDTAAGTAAELLGRTPWLRPEQSALVPGSANEVYGSGLQDDLLAVTVNTRIVPLLDRAPARVIFQLPGDYPTGSDVKVRLVIPSEAPFFGSLNYVTGVVGSRPSVFGNPIHQDWDRIVWQDDPARPGQFVHLYAIGLPTLTRLPICYYGDRIPGPTLDVWYAGPAPGFPGFWQLDLRLPDTDANPLPVHCVFEDNSDIQLHVRIPFRP